MGAVRMQRSTMRSDHIRMMCALAFIAVSFAAVSHDPPFFDRGLRLETSDLEHPQSFLNYDVSPAFNFGLGNITHSFATKQVKQVQKVCPSRKAVSVKARGSMRTDLNLKKDNVLEEKKADLRQESDEFFVNEDNQQHVLSNWDNFDPDDEGAGFEEVQEHQEVALHRRELEAKCVDHKEHDMRVHCMVDAIFVTQKEAMHIEENDGKVKVISSASGQVIFEDLMTDPGQLLEDGSRNPVPFMGHLSEASP